MRYILFGHPDFRIIPFGVYKDKLPQVRFRKPYASAFLTDPAKKFHKASGIRLNHIILSFAEDEFVSPCMAATVVEGISQRIGQVYQNFYVVHEDHAFPHIHMMISTVNHINGYKYQPQKDKFWLSDIAADFVHEFGIVQFRVYGRIWRIPKQAEKEYILEQARMNKG